MKRKISKIVIGGETFYRAEISAKGAKKRQYATRKSKAELEQLLKIREDFEKRDATASLAKNFSIAQLADITRAMALLPAGRTLSECVQAFAQKSTTTTSDALAQFLDVKSGIFEDVRYYNRVKNRLTKFCQKFPSFDDCNQQAIWDWLHSLTGKTGQAKPKTKLHYFSSISMFFDWCNRRDIIPATPFAKMSTSDLPKPKSKPEALSIDQTKAFMLFIKTHYPQHLSFYAIALFAGIRVDEIERLLPKDVDKKGKKIFISAENSKTNRAEVLEDFEPNLWAWLSVASPKIIRPSDHVRASFSQKIGFRLPHNFARHSFATYHYSLYLDAKRTCAITRHSEEMLKRHYLSMRVDKETAKKYFSILPD